jgi:hypothetical protein
MKVLCPEAVVIDLSEQGFVAILFDPVFFGQKHRNLLKVCFKRLLQMSISKPGLLSSS